jgi:hypothetical protein
MSGYLGVLKATSQAKHFYSAIFRSLFRTYAESHIRKRLRDIRNAYIQLRQTLNSKEEAAYCEWLDEATQRLEDFRSTLSSWRVPKVIALIPAAIALIATTLGLIGVEISVVVEENKPEDKSEETEVDTLNLIIGWIVGLILMGIVYLALLMWSGFRAKRKLFLGIAQVEHQPESGLIIAPKANIYGLEQRLFQDVLKRGRTIETQVDLNLEGAALAILLAGLAAWLESRNALLGGLKAAAIGGSVIFVLVSVCRTAFSDRTHR